MFLDFPCLLPFCCMLIINCVNAQFCFEIMLFVEWEENKMIVDNYFNILSENITMTGQI